MANHVIHLVSKLLRGFVKDRIRLVEIERANKCNGSLTRVAQVIGRNVLLESFEAINEIRIIE